MHDDDSKGPDAQSDEQPTEARSPSEKSTVPLPPRESHPKQIGPFRILEKLGEGAMGIVYLAEQEKPIRRRVALKLIKLGMDTKEVLARFESERQALALMNHQNIAKVFEAGATEQGRPYFIMEHVAGLPITQYCDRHRLTNRERLALFIPVCQAIHHAHQKAIIHRDVKPSNILVSVQDGKPVPKVIDFGVAKATNQRLTEQTIFTEQGVLMGTPEYMSPEQAEMTALDIDTTTDIYSLGVVLYELLVGELPLDPKELRKAGFDEMRRIIREVDPPRPSVRISTLGPKSGGSAQNRQTTISALQRQIRGELDWITLKAMEKDRTRRYLSASEFAADVHRYLHDEIVLASPPRVTYKLRKALQKHRGLVASSLAVMVALSIGLVISETQRQRAVNSEAEAHESAQEAAESLKRARASTIVTLASSSDDPVLGSLLLAELLGYEEPPLGLQVAIDVARALDRGDPLVLDANATLVINVAWSPDSKQLVAAHQGGVARVWSIDDKELQPVVIRHTAVVTHAEFSPDGKMVLTASRDGTARISNAEDGREFASLRGHDGPVLYAEFSRDGSAVVTASSDATAAIWHSDGTGQQMILRGHEGTIRHAGFSPDGSRVVTASMDRTIRVWDIATGESTVLSGHRSPVLFATFSPDGLRVLSRDGRCARLWWLDESATPVDLCQLGPVTSVVFGPDAQSVITGGKDSYAWVHSVDETTHGTMAALQHPSWVTEVELSPDKSTLATGCADGKVRIWPSDGGGEPVVVGPQDNVIDVAYSPDGTRIATVTMGGVIRIWRVQWQAILEHLEQEIDKCLSTYQRYSMLGETSEEVRANYEACMKRHGLEVSLPPPGIVRGVRPSP